MILTKVDGDARGGAALSVKEVVGRPIVFTSTGEKLGDFDQFHPDRMADRILGMGDVLTLIEKAEANLDREQAEVTLDRLQQGQFTLEDFLDQMQQVKKMGPLSGLVGMIPGLPKELRNAEIDDDLMGPIEAIIRSMTPEERQNPSIINGSRRLRIARGSGTSTTEVNSLLDRFKQMQAYMRQMAAMPGLTGRMARRAGQQPEEDQQQEEEAPLGVPDTRESSQANGRKTPPDADGKEEAAGVPGGGRRQPIAAGWPFHRDPGHLRAAGRAQPDRDRQRQGRALVARRRPADRNRGPAARPVRRHGGVQVGRRGRPAVSTPGEGGGVPARRERPVDLESSEEWDDHGQVDGGRAKSVLLFLARRLVDDPESIRVDTSETRHGIKLSLRVAPDDMGKVIGRRGRVAQSIRSVVRAAGAKDGVDVIVDIVD